MIDRTKPYLSFGKIIDEFFVFPCNTTINVSIVRKSAKAEIDTTVYKDKFVNSFT